MPRANSTTRRDFLSGRSLAVAAQAAAEAADGIAVPDPIGPDARSDMRLTASRRAMACLFQIMVPCPNAVVTAAASAALDEIEQLDDQLTVYRETSEVSRINLLAGDAPVPVEERLFELLEMALRLNEQTNGAFDIAVGPLVKCWGFFRGPKRVPDAAELADVMERVGSRHVALNRERRTVAFRRPGVELNLGAIGKGYALDRAAERLRDGWEVSRAILHGGRSSVLAIGAADDQGADAAGWLVGILHPLDPTRRVAAVRLRDAALGTSGAMIQYFEAGGRRFGHILDPRTGWPADGLVPVSVIAPTAAEADALSTAMFILGPEATRDLCRQHPEIGAVLVRPSGEGQEIEVEVVGRADGIVQLEEPNALDP